MASPNLQAPRVLGLAEEDNLSADERDISDQCVWTVSSCKQGYGVRNLRDGVRDTYWQSDGVQPHLINMEFQEKTVVNSIMLNLNYSSDESYTPNKVAVKAGTHFHDLQMVCVRELDHPQVWETIQLKDKNSKPVAAFLLQIVIVSNHQNGRDCRIRQVKVLSQQVQGKSRQSTSCAGDQLTVSSHPMNFAPDIIFNFR